MCARVSVCVCACACMCACVCLRVCVCVCVRVVYHKTRDSRMAYTFKCTSKHTCNTKRIHNASLTHAHNTVLVCPYRSISFLQQMKKPLKPLHVAVNVESETHELDYPRRTRDMGPEAKLQVSAVMGHSFPLGMHTAAHTATHSATHSAAQSPLDTDGTTEIETYCVLSHGVGNITSHGAENILSHGAGNVLRTKLATSSWPMYTFQGRVPQCALTVCLCLCTCACTCACERVKLEVDRRTDI